MDRPLHPNLARIAASYDEVMNTFRQGQISPAEARRRVLALVARDDNGLEWSISPDSGLWQYRSHWGEMVSSEPPAQGVAAFTPEDLGGGRALPEQERVRLYEVDQSLLFSPRQLRGSTSLQQPTISAHRRPVRSLVAACAGIVMLLIALVLR